jgi:RecB family endonuclease NucS
MDCHSVTITLKQVPIKSVISIDVLGVKYDNKVNWFCQVNICIKKSKAALHAIRLIKGYFKKAEIKQLITFDFY